MGASLVSLAQQSPRLAELRIKRILKRTSRDRYFAGVFAMLKPGDIVLDCGANVGSMTARFVQRGAHVHAFEPDPVAHETLSGKFADHPLVTIHNAAVGTEDGEAVLFRIDSFEDNPTGHTVSSTLFAQEGNYHDSGVKVKIVDIVTFIKTLTAHHREIALLKLDIEGAEVEILEALAEQKMFDQIRYTLVETHERKRPEAAARFAALRAAAAENPTWNLDLSWI